MKSRVRDPWFVRRKLGYGWRPVSWQGWAVTAVLLALAIGAALAVKSSSICLVVIIGAGAAYALVATLTAGSKPGSAESGDDDAQAPEAGSGDPNGSTPGSSQAARSVVPLRRSLSPMATIGNGRGAAIVVNGLTRRFGERTAVDGVSFTVGYGEVFGFLGPNGAGKTTTVRMLGTLIAPTAGSAVIDGVRLSEANGVEVRRRISIMPETPGLYQRLTVRENLDFFAGLYGVPDSGPRIAQALESVGLEHRVDDPCGSLSKGLRQRVALARALLNDPRILFLDEPTSGLDPVAAREVHELIDGLRDRGVTIFLTTHRLEEAERLCDRVAILNTTLRTIGRPDQLEKQLFHAELLVKTAAPLTDPERLFGHLPVVTGWQADGTNGYVLNVADPTSAAPAVSRALVESGADLVSIGEARHSLEDVYLELVEEDVEAARS